MPSNEEPGLNPRQKYNEELPGRTEKELDRETLRIADGDKTLPQLEGKLDSNTFNERNFSQAKEPRPGETFNNQFEIIELIGRGGMSKVYKALDKRLGRTVALKTLLPHLLENEESIKRFQREAQSIGGIKHNSVVQVFEFDIANDIPYIVMEYLEGKDLSSIIEEEGYLSSERAVPIFLKICDALRSAHAGGVIHRDLKPSNVLLGERDDQKDIVGVVDFGLAKFMPHANKETASLTATGQIFGSPPYMSPEQCQGLKLDERADIYSMGCLMYETITGKPPFEGETPVATIMKHMTEYPAPPTSHVLVPPKLEAIILKALEKNAGARQQSMDELYKELEDFSHLQKTGLEHKPVGLGARVLRLNNRLPKKYLFLIVVILVFFVSRLFADEDSDPEGRMERMQTVIIGFLVFAGIFWFYKQRFSIKNLDKEIENLLWVEEKPDHSIPVQSVEENIKVILERIKQGNLANSKEQIILLRENMNKLVESKSFEFLDQKLSETLRLLKEKEDSYRDHLHLLTEISGDCKFHKGELAQAEAFYREIAYEGEKSSPKTELKLADTLFKQKRYADAQTIYSAVLFAQEKKGIEDESDHALRTSKMADCYLKMGSFKHAEESYEKAMSYYSRANETGKVKIDTLTNNSIAYLKYAYTSASRFQPIKIDRQFEQAVENIKTGFGEDSKEYGTALKLYSTYLWKEKKFFQAFDNYNEAARVEKRRVQKSA